MGDESNTNPSFFKTHTQDFHSKYGLSKKWGVEESGQRRNESGYFELNDDKLNSDVDATERHVKRNNLVDFFLKGTDVDDYIVQHMYGRVKIEGGQ